MKQAGLGLRATRVPSSLRSLVIVLLGLMATAIGGAQAATCTGGDVATSALQQNQPQPDLEITGDCTIKKEGQYYYGNVNIVGPNGSLTFVEPSNDDSRVEFWASSIIIENDGALIAGSPAAYGARGGILTIYIYGKDQSQGNPMMDPGKGTLCQTDMSASVGPCGVPLNLWTDNGKNLFRFSNGVTDFFYQYGPMMGDNKCSDDTLWSNGKCGAGPADGKVGYFGYKVLAVSYGGNLLLNGTKGTSTESNPLSTGQAWMRLAGNPSPTTLTLSATPGPNKWWRPQDGTALDKMVITTTDYLPGHSEEVFIDSIAGNTVTFHPALKWFHQNTRFPLKDRLAKAQDSKGKPRFGLDSGMDQDLVNKGVEDRAAVALLTRSIRIVSAGDKAGEKFEDAGNVQANCKNGAEVPYCYSFGAHTVFRQGFQKIQIQGVEFMNMGQAGVMSRYPVHFHEARQVPQDTWIKDSVINYSMTRWIVLHSTQGVLLQRNIGYKSIGHGFYLEDGTEADNKFYANLGIFARAAVNNVQNLQKIPGILAATGDQANGNKLDNNTVLPDEAFPYRSDYDHPAVFWISNGWNDFIGNMAAGAGTCGAAYWLVPAWNSDRPDVPTADNVDFGTHMKWYYLAGKAPNQRQVRRYPALQTKFDMAGTTPLKSFFGNYATSTMNSFQTVSNTAPCLGVAGPYDPGADASKQLLAIPSIAPRPHAPPEANIDADPYYPHVGGGNRYATKCPHDDTLTGPGEEKYNCTGLISPAHKCANGGDETYCQVTVLDHYTSSFHWAHQNFAAIWLRPQWYLIDNSVLTDVQNGGITMLTSGDYSRSSVIEGDWAVVRNSIFIGNTQPTGSNRFATNAGPFNQPFGEDDPKCLSGNVPDGDHCLNKDQGVSFPLVNFAVNQRLFNIYDGPAYEDSNAFLDITTTPCSDCMYSKTLGVRKDSQSNCYLPNAAIAWKQPNGFFYPPSFHSRNMFFDNVSIRHFVIDPQFLPDTYITDTTNTGTDYCTSNPTMFAGYTDVDRQTELNDDDGTLTGLTNNVTPNATGTISVNPVEFFSAPVETPECLSNAGVTPDKACPATNGGSLPATPTPASATTSPYDYVTTVVYPECGLAPVTNPPKCGEDTADDLVVIPPAPPTRPNAVFRYLKKKDRAGTWSLECSNEACYGVPLYRQFLTTGANGADGREWKRWKDAGCDSNQNQAACRWPFVRMSGQSTYQRSSLTANHGTYYLDTTVTRTVQWTGEAFSPVKPCDDPTVGPNDPCARRSVNVFQGGQTYYVFFLFAKRATKQTYQIYVGPGFNLASDFKTKTVTVNTLPITGADIKDLAWPGAEAHYNDSVACPTTPNCGILQVTVDFANVPQVDLKPGNGLCYPHNFCSPVGTTDCGCSLSKNDPLAVANPGILAECSAVCSTWAMSDLDFPEAGPMGFSFKLPADFSPDDSGLTHRPKVTTFPTAPDTGKPDWLAKFDNTPFRPDSDTGVCYYSKLPGTASCPIP